MSHEIDLRNAAQQKNVRNFSPEQTRFTAGLEKPKNFFVQRAIEHLRNISSTLGLEATQPAEFAADHQFQRTSSGAVAVHAYQLYKNIPVFQAAHAVIFAPDGSLQQTNGAAVAIASDLDVAPKLSATEAALVAARFAAAPDQDVQKDQFGTDLPRRTINVDDFKPTLIATFPDLAEHPTVLDRGSLGDFIKVSLIWFPLQAAVRLCWEVVISLHKNEDMFRILVDADNGQILYCTDLMQSVAAKGSVFRANGGDLRQIASFPLPLAEYGLPIPADLPPGFPDDWVSSSDTSGNAIRAVLDSTGATVSGVMTDGSLLFDPADPAGDQQNVLNLFFYTNYMHDFFYLLGFRERDGNFQQDNLNRGGIPLDGLDARAAPGAVFATANMNTPCDGQPPNLNVGIVDRTGRHTALDATVVFHEFTHGVTNRLVGGPQNNHALESQQSKSMGEGWGDFFACVMNNTKVVGAWVVNDPAGIRAFPYDANFPDDFGKLGTGRYSESHNVGEIWCAALMEMFRRIGKSLSLQLVVDALKLSPANPNFLDMRDAILLALDHRLDARQITQTTHDDASSKIWGAFAKFGMGQHARANGSSYTGNIADFTSPPAAPAGPTSAAAPIHVEKALNLAIPDKDPVGVASTISIATAGRLATVSISLNIAHDFIGDLRITLTSAQGSTVTLRDAGMDSARDLVFTFTPATTPSLSAIVGQNAQGNWVLRVADMFRLNTGTLRSWAIDMTFENALA